MSDIVSLDAVRAECLQCTQCHLAKTRTKVVFSDGNPQAPLMIVGEGPGDNEDRTGVPFVGRAGKLLDACLLENAITRKWVYICNTVKCRACNVEGTRVSNRPPSAEEMQTCWPWLEQQIQIIRPVVILCVGSPSANTVIHKDFKITRERGTWFTDVPHAPWVIASWHPAYILRQGAEAFERTRGELVADIDKCRKKIIEVRQQGGLLARGLPAQPEVVREPEPGMSLF